MWSYLRESLACWLCVRDKLFNYQTFAINAFWSPSYLHLNSITHIQREYTYTVHAYMQAWQSLALHGNKQFSMQDSAGTSWILRKRKDPVVLFINWTVLESDGFLHVINDRRESLSYHPSTSWYLPKVTIKSSI